MRPTRVTGQLLALASFLVLGCVPGTEKRDAPTPPRWTSRAIPEAQLGMRPLVAHCRLGLGKLYRRSGKRPEADEHLSTVTTRYREMVMTYWLEKAETELVRASR